MLDVAIGTYGLKTKNSKYSVFSPLTIGEVPTDVHPVARLEFPNEAAGGAAIPLEVTLDQRCCGDTFYSRVEVPEGVGHGKVKVTVAFPDWPEGEVAPATFEVALE